MTVHQKVQGELYLNVNGRHYAGKLKQFSKTATKLNINSYYTLNFIAKYAKKKEYCNTGYTKLLQGSKKMQNNSVKT